MQVLSHIWFIMLKDLKLFFRDRMALFFWILFPFIFVIAFNFILSDVGGGDDRLTLNVTTLEKQGGISYEIIATIETLNLSQLEPGEPAIHWDRDYYQARQAVTDGELEGFLAFRKDFTYGLTHGNGSEIVVVANPDDIGHRAALQGMAGSIATHVGSLQVAAGATVQLLVDNGLIDPGDTQAIEQVYDEMMAVRNASVSEPAVAFDTQSIGDVEPENAANFVIPGYLVMFVFFAAALGAEIVVRERQNHTLERLLASSVRREAILGGIFAGTAAKGLVQIAVFWAVGILAFDIDLGLSPAAVILLSFLVVIMSAAFAMMLASVVRTQRSAGSLAVLCALILAPLGGCWWPLFIVPSWMQFLAKLTPHGWATSGFNKLMLFGADFGAVVPEMLALLGFAALFALIGVWRFRTSAA